MGFCRFNFLLKLPIDKLLAVWYNGNSARLGRGRAAKCTKTQGRPLGFILWPALLWCVLALRHTPSIQDGTGHWDGGR